MPSRNAAGTRAFARARFFLALDLYDRVRFHGNFFEVPRICDKNQWTMTSSAPELAAALEAVATC